MNLPLILQERLTSALKPITDTPEKYADMLRAAGAKFGDYQANCAMPLAKQLGRKPRDVAADIVTNLDLGDMLEPPEIAGPGFINLTFKDEWLAVNVRETARDERLGVTKSTDKKTYLIDYSSPNVAKPMHVGHLRSTIIGDSLARLLRFLGHKVIADNHLGDWGTQFGILIYGYKNFLDQAALKADPVGEMVRIYVHVRDLIKEAGGGDEEDAHNEIADACRHETAKLHAGDEENLALWQKMMPWCLEELDRIYRRLDIRFDYTLGESFYQPKLADVVEELRENNVAQLSEGAMAVFFGENESPALVRKRDGAFTYTTTDIATIRHRMKEFSPDVILYVVDFRQKLHFEQLFSIIGRLYGADVPELYHISFGSVLGNDHRPIKTREGGAIELGDLLNEAVERARTIVDANSSEIAESERAAIAEVVGLGAVKYADLSQNRASDYVFSWDKMLAMDGNTATYMQYAYARVRSVFRKGNINPDDFCADPPKLMLSMSHERALALALLRFPESLDAAAIEFKPSTITTYLWDVANAYSSFYQNCPVLKADTVDIKNSRLLLCDLTARIIKQGLHILGIDVIEQM